MRELTQIDPFKDHEGSVAVVIETPKGSRTKISYKDGMFQLSGVLPQGMSFPYDFGFVPATKGGDGDPLDVLILLDESVPMGCVVEARFVGVIEAMQREENGEESRNDRLIAVATRARAHQHIHHLDDLTPGLIDEIEHFFIAYNEVKGKEFKPQRRGGPERAVEIAKEAKKRYRR